MEFVLRDGVEDKGLEHWSHEYEDRWPKEKALTTGLRDIGKKAEPQEGLGLEGLRRMVKWKAPRAVHHVEGNSDEYAREVTEVAIQAHEEGRTDRFLVDVLTLLAGVRIRVASAIAFFLWGEEYPVMDWRALESLSVPDSERSYSAEDYEKYADKCRELGEEAGLSAREVDKALWAYSDSRNNT